MDNRPLMTDRRQFLSAGAICAVSALPAVALAPAAHTDPVGAYMRAYTAFNSDQIGEDEYFAAFDRMDDNRVTTHRDFVRKFVAMWQGQGFPNEERIEAMLDQARRLLGDA